VISHIVKDAAFWANPGWTGEGPDIIRLAETCSLDQTEVHEVIAEMRRTVDIPLHHPARWRI